MAPSSYHTVPKPGMLASWLVNLTPALVAISNIGCSALLMAQSSLGILSFSGHFGPIFLGDLVLLWTLWTHVSILARAVTHLHVFVLHEACLACLHGIILVILQSCSLPSCLMLVMLVVTQYVCCLSNVDWIQVVVQLCTYTVLLVCIRT